MKFNWNGYWKPTPKKIRKLADAIIAATTFSGSLVVLNGDAKVGTVIFVIGFIAKILSNFFTEDGTKAKPRRKA